MGKIIQFPVIENSNDSNSNKIKKEDVQMKTNIIKISDIAKKKALFCCSALLMLLASLFAAAPCIGHFYEPEVPEKLHF